MFPTLSTPCLLVEEPVLQRNLARAAAVATRAGCLLRPHIKTHKSPELALRQAKAGAAGFTCATIAEAAALFEAGLTDVFLAYPVVGEPAVAAFLELRRRGRLACAVDHADQVLSLARAARDAGLTVPVRLEIDCGHHRCGLPPGPALLELARLVAATPGLALEGVFTHAGHAYGARTPEALAAAGRQEGEAVVAAAALLREKAGLEVAVVSVGSTPTMTVSPFVAGVTEMRPGNYVFHDGIQVQLGVCGWEDAALSVLATVIAVFPDRVVIDAGSKAAGLDKGAHGLSLMPGYGHFPDHPEWVLGRLSEEHGVIDLPEPHEAGRPVRIGDRVRFVPNHACAVVNLHPALHLVAGDSLLASWKVTARR
ncbi:MAG: alanine racemase [Candidatus Riflebacteria bacterium]|nr:alanine racemase [Candidatus Riflebacteria bacterium]